MQKSFSIKPIRQSQSLYQPEEDKNKPAGKFKINQKTSEHWSTDIRAETHETTENKIKRRWGKLQDKQENESDMP